MRKKNKILFISNSSPSKTVHFLDSFNDRNDLIVDVEHLWIERRKESKLTKIFDKLKLPLDIDRINKRLREKILSFNPNILFIMKGNAINPFLLKMIKNKYPKIKIISYSNDNMGLWHNKSIFYHIGKKYYDMIISINIESYKNVEKNYLGKCIYIDKSYSKKYHFPMKTEKKYDVLFIGSYEKERFLDLCYLADNGIKIDVFGDMWDKATGIIHKNLKIHYKPLLGEEYRLAINSSKIILGFLRKLNFDTQTSRTFEIPACGGFMLMERTQNHCRLFEENKEAVYFSSNEELKYKINKYLLDDDIRSIVEINARKRCIDDKYSFDDRVDTILKEISKI